MKKISRHPALLTPKELAARWKLSPGTLANWRVKGIGPKYMKLGWGVVYPLAEVISYEKKKGIAA